MAVSSANVNPKEVAHFEALANVWWDPQGKFRTLHVINPVRVGWICQHSSPANKQVLDVGCGGGLLSEAMACAGGKVTGIDIGEAPLHVARLHSLESGVEVDYQQTTAEDMAAKHPAKFDLITCLEMLEHVPEPAVAIAAMATLAKPDAHLFFSTINRNAIAWLGAIIGAEYVLNLVPKGTHTYSQFIRPSELARFCRDAGLQVQHIQGMSYDPFRHQCKLTRKVAINYLLHCVK